MTKGIIIFGASGSGTTTIGKALSQKLQYPHYDLDDYFWLWDTEIPYTTPRPANERMEKLECDLSKVKSFVTSGSICGWDIPFIPILELAVFLKTPTDLRIKRLKEREFKEFGNRVLESGDMYTGHIDFIEWAKTYDNAGLDSRSLVLHTEWAKSLPCKVIELDGSLPIDDIVNRVITAFEKMPSNINKGL